jgi:uncharacterized protein (TIGR02001 family)
MKMVVASLMAAAALCTSPALAADLMPVKARPAPAAPASPWDLAFGAALMSDYNFRGISQSDRGPSVAAYVETRYNVNSNLQLYFNTTYYSVNLPTNPSCECDFIGGIRPTVGPFAFDFGAIYYYYPREKGHSADPAALFPPFPNGNVTYNNTDYWEVFGKVTWEAVKDKLAFGANVYHAPDWLQTGAEATFASVTAKLTLPNFNMPLYGGMQEIGWYVSGEFGHYWIGNTEIDPFVWTIAADLPDYSTWNVGLAFTWKVFTLDLRYYDTDLSREECNVLTGDPRAAMGGTVSVLNPGGLRSNLCNATFIATFKADLTLANLK